MKLKNPQKRILLRWIIIDVFGLILSISNIAPKPFNWIIILITATIIITSFFFIPQTIKNIKLMKTKPIIHWEYTKEEWSNYQKHEKIYRRNESIFIAIVLFVITTIVFIPFVIIEKGMFIPLLILYGIYGFMVLFSMGPRSNKGEVILFEKGLLINNRFHTWDFPFSKFGFAKHITKPYDHLIINYEFLDRTGPRDYAVNIPIPKNNKKEIKEIIQKFK